MFAQDDNQSTANPTTLSEGQNDTSAQVPAQAPAQAQAQTPVQAPAQDNYVSSYQPPPQETSSVESAKLAQPIQSVQSVQPVSPDLPDQSAQPVQPSEVAQTDGESFVPPSESTSQEPVTQEPSSGNQDSINEKLEELEKLVESFEKESDPGQIQEETPQETKVEATDNQLNQEDSMDKPQDNAQNSTSQDVVTTNSEPAANQASQGSAQESVQSETLADQNIFFLLGAQEGSTQEQEQFLDELQQVIWEDFLQTDLDLLITSQEKEQIDQILQDSNLDDQAKQEEILKYLDGIIPDLEEIMLEKALKLKGELVQERVASLKETLAEDQDKLAKLEEINQLLAQNKWYSAGVMLNQLS